MDVYKDALTIQDARSCDHHQSRFHCKIRYYFSAKELLVGEASNLRFIQLADAHKHHGDCSAGYW